jgi:cysteinyl-tRNA synthetase
MRIYNTLSRQVEEFVPINPPKVGMYTCGPTVYFYPQIGNWRTFVFEDILRRVLEYNRYEVVQVMNITDVGHLTGDNIGDADVGEDRLEKAAEKENKSAWDIAAFYTNDFIESSKRLNIKPPHVLPKATDHIAEQIALVQSLLDKGLAYKTGKAIYFDVIKLPDYGKLGGQKLIDKRVASREELVEDQEKKNPFDFALWKFSVSEEKRQMEWQSPWGVGFPGWHIECSAMSMKYLGASFDIHTGGIDHVAIHHTNEIAQSEGVTGKPLARYWLHGAFLTVDGGRMGKSLGNAYTLQDVEAKGFDPMDLRYFYLLGHYRKQLNFTWEALKAAREARLRLVQLMQEFRKEQERTILSEEKLKKVDDYRQRFMTAIQEDLNMPQALAVVWEVVKSNIPGEDKFDLIREMDEVMGLQLQVPVTSNQIPEKTIPGELQELLSKREEMRRLGKYEEADEVRKQIEGQGYVVEDGPQGVTLRRV